MSLNLKDILLEIQSLKRKLCSRTYTVATLPTGCLGMRAIVTDATAPSYLQTLVGGGTVVSPAFFNGVSWISA